MKRLSRENFNLARKFLKTEARPLERTLFEFWFEDEKLESVYSELAKFQNTDGGFGHALEPDMRTPSSSALATGIGMETLKAIGCPADHPLVTNAVKWLEATYQQDTKVWRVIPMDANAYPHAPWWHDEEGSLAQTFDGFRIIPRVLLVGLLHHFSDFGNQTWFEALTEETVQYIEAQQVLGSGGGSDLEYAIHLAETEELPAHYRERLEKILRKAIPEVIARDIDKWEQYSITPLKVVPTPDALGADLIQEALQKHLDWVVAHQTPEGTWEPTWSWGEFNQNYWQQAKCDWTGYLTLNTLRSLQSFGRIEG